MTYLAPMLLLSLSLFEMRKKKKKKTNYNPKASLHSLHCFYFRGVGSVFFFFANIQVYK